MLASQFVTGLRPELQSKVVGLEGNMDQLMMKACFEEAKGKELAATKTSTPQKKTYQSGQLELCSYCRMLGSPPATRRLSERIWRVK